MESETASQLQREGVKYDKGKLRYDLIPPAPLEELVAVYTMGAEKYDDRNWEKGMKWGRIFGALMRHAWRFWAGDEKDHESGLHPLAHAAWCCFTLMEYARTHRELDDRPKAAKAQQRGQEDTK